jgi:hypothetical protein
MDRRDFLAGMLQALLLALFPWLRNERGLVLTEQAAEQAVERYLFVLQPGGVAKGNVFSDWTTLYARLVATGGPKTVVIDDSFAASAPLPPGTYDLGDTTITSIGEGHLQVPAQGEVTFLFEDSRDGNGR